MKRINTLAELKEEQKALRIRKADLESAIKKDVDEIKADLAPVLALTKGVKHMLSSNDNSILGKSAGTAVGFVAKNAIFRNSGFLTKLVLPFLMKNVASNVVEDHKSQIVDWLDKLVSKFVKKERVEENA